MKAVQVNEFVLQEDYTYALADVSLHEDEDEAINHVVSRVAAKGFGGVVPTLNGRMPVMRWTTTEAEIVGVNVAAGRIGDENETRMSNAPEAPPPPDEHDFPDDEE